MRGSHVTLTTDMPVALGWSQSGGVPDVTRHFESSREAAEEEAMARIYGGIHHRFDQDAGQQVGQSVAEYVFANFTISLIGRHEPGS